MARWVSFNLYWSILLKRLISTLVYLPNLLFLTLRKQVQARSNLQMQQIDFVRKSSYFFIFLQTGLNFQEIFIFHDQGCLHLGTGDEVVSRWVVAFIIKWYNFLIVCQCSNRSKSFLSTKIILRHDLFYWYFFLDKHWICNFVFSKELSFQQSSPQSNQVRAWKAKATSQWLPTHTMSWI